MTSYSTALEAYLKSELYPVVQAGLPTRPALPFMTISRETGAGGHWIGRLLLEHLNRDHPEPAWCLADAEFFQKMLKDDLLDVSMKRLVDDEFHSQTEEAFYQMLSPRSSQDMLYHKIFKMMRLLACRGRVILLGRGGVCATARLSQGLHFRLVAPLATRIQRMMAILSAPERQARQAIIDQDLARTRLVRNYFDRDISDPDLYHAIWNTAKIPPSEITAMIVGMVAKREHESARLDRAASGCAGRR